MPDTPDFGIEMAEIERLVALVESRRLAELVVEEDGVEIRIRGVRRGGPRRVGELAAPRDGAAPEPSHRPAAGSHAKVGDRIAVSSPTVGVFYRSGGPDMPAYVEVGDHVEAGQTVGLLEAMKVFSEIPAEQ